MFNIALQKQHCAGLSQNHYSWKPVMRLLQAVGELSIEHISSTSGKINLPLPLVAAVVQIWCSHPRSILCSRGYTLKVRGEGWGKDPQKMIQTLENKLYEVNCREASH